MPIYFCSTDINNDFILVNFQFYADFMMINKISDINDYNCKIIIYLNNKSYILNQNYSMESRL